VLTAIAVLCGAGLIAGVTAPVAQYLTQELGRRSALLARRRLFDAVAALDELAPFEDPMFLNRLRLAENAGTSAPAHIVAGGLRLAQSGIAGAALIGSLWSISTAMTLVLVVASLPALAADLWLSRRRADVLRRTSPIDRRELFYSMLLSDVQAAKEIRLFGLGGFLRDRMLTERRSADRLRRTADRRELGVQTGLCGLSALVSGGGLLWMGSLAAHGALSVGDVAMFIAAIAGMQGALSAAILSIATLHQETLLFKAFVEIEDTPASATTPTRATLPPLQHAIEFRDVWFRYDEHGPWVLRGVDLVIPAGSTVGLVGRNGAGKSTLVKLLCRLYRPTRGSIRWDGIDIATVPADQLRARLGAVFQDFMCYDLTAAENIGIGDLARLDDRQHVVAAAGHAGVHDTVERLRRGYDTMLSRTFFDDADPEEQAGLLLSGGQWQRLAIARAFMRTDRDVVVLDEPTSGLDAEAEFELHRAIRRHGAAATRLLISHRLGSVRTADLIVALDGGRIVEAGTHATLLATDGVYSRLFRRQADGYQDVAPALLEAL
jgi:ATP-binding cassette subfamily B protein